MPREKAQGAWQSVAELQDGSWVLRAGHSTAGCTWAFVGIACGDGSMCSEWKCTCRSEPIWIELLAYKQMEYWTNLKVT